MDLVTTDQARTEEAVPASRELFTPRFPWIIEEKIDASRLHLRCSELEGGCGDTLEICAATIRCGGKQVKSWPGYIAWHRVHLHCNADHNAQRPLRIAAAKAEVERQEADAKSLALRNLEDFAVRRALIVSCALSANYWKERKGAAMSDAELRNALLAKLAAGHASTIPGVVEWSGGHSPVIKVLNENAKVLCILTGDILLAVIRRALDILPAAAEAGGA